MAKSQTSDVGRSNVTKLRFDQPTLISKEHSFVIIFDSSSFMKTFQMYCGEYVSYLCTALYIFG